MRLNIGDVEVRVVGLSGEGLQLTTDRLNRGVLPKLPIESRAFSVANIVIGSYLLFITSVVARSCAKAKLQHK
jgi:hypothetical protein